MIDSCGLPLHFHTVGGYMPDHLRKIVMIGSDPTRAKRPDAPNVELPVARSAFATNITHFQINMANILTSMIFSGVLERYPRMRLVLGECGIGWIPYVLWRMDAEWEDQFKDLSLTMPPSEYWKRQCWATYQTDPIGVKLLDELGADQGHVGLGLPPSRRGVAGFSRVHRPRARPPPGGRAPQGRLRERRKALRADQVACDRPVPGGLAQAELNDGRGRALGRASATRWSS